ncbi:MAG: stage II sporulation protein M [Clostridiaceae bacterium]|nr:stage II sporulation protein M [Clostridiaceae bacterium]
MSRSKYNYRVYNGKVIKKALENSRIYFLTSFFSIGIIIGATAINNDFEVTEKLSAVIDSFIVLRSGQGILHNFCNSLTINSLFIASNLFFGFSLIGYPFIMWLPFLRGMGIGMVSGYLYSVYKLTGLGYSVLIIYPGAVVATFSFILACNASCEYSKNAYAKAVRGRGQFEKDETGVFVMKQLVLLGISAVSALIDAMTAAAFSRFFEI